MGGSKRAIQTFLLPGDHRSLELLELIIPGLWWRAGGRKGREKEPAANVWIFLQI